MTAPAILIVDDDDVFRERLARALRERGHEVTIAADAAAALELDVDELVEGTNAEGRLAAIADHIRRSDYEEAVGKVIEYETRIRDLEARCRSQEEVVGTESRARRAAAPARAHPSLCSCHPSPR
jgi:hypothetical protein